MHALVVAGVATSNMYPEARSVGTWLRSGWHVTVAYIVGFLVLLLSHGWHPPSEGIIEGDATRGAPVAISTRRFGPASW